MRFLRNFWQRSYRPILALLSLACVFIWGVNVGRSLGPQPAPSQPVPLEETSGEQVELVPAGLLELELDPPPPDVTPPAWPHLSVRVDVRDALSRKPVRADVWLTTVTGEESEERLVGEKISLVEVELPGPSEVDEVYLKVQAPGYLVWSIGLRHRVEYDRLLPLPVMLERLPGSGGSG